MNKHTFIIAEGGVNHNGSVEIAKKMIEEVANCEADVVSCHICNVAKNVVDYFI